MRLRKGASCTPGPTSEGNACVRGRPFAGTDHSAPVRARSAVRLPATSARAR